MNIKLICGDYDIAFSSAQWSGTDEQCCRTLQFSIANNPIDRRFQNPNIKLGDKVYFSADGAVFTGFITDIEKKSTIGEVTYTAKDIVYHLLKSNGTFNFKNTTPESITKTVCSNIGSPIGSLLQSNVNIPSMIVNNCSYYDIIIKAYTRAYESKGIYFMVTVDNNNQISVIEKWKHCGRVLDTMNDIIDSKYSANINNVVDKVVIYDSKNQRIGTVTDDNLISKYGIFQQVYTEQEGVYAQDAARSMLKDKEESASISAIGDVSCISGREVSIEDKEIGLTGIYYIKSDSHKFSNGIHTMDLDLRFKKYQETSDIEEDKEE